MHPLDLPRARRPFRISWLIGALTSPPVAALAAVIIWFASHNYLVPLIAGAAILGFGQLAGRVYQDQAWAFIPRKRHDRPAAPAGAVGAGGRPGPGDRAGGGAGAGGVPARPAGRVGLRYRGRALYPRPGAVAVLGSPAVAYGVLFGSLGPSSLGTVLWGVAAMLVSGAAVGIWKLRS